MAWLLSLAVSLILIALALLAFWRLWFLRLPERTTPKTGLISPASGKIVRIIEFKGGEPQEIPKGLLGMVRTLTEDVGKDGSIIVIMLTPLDVHYQRAPLDGTLIAQKYSKGKFKNAVFGAGDLAAFENEKNEMLFLSGKEKVKVVQVAGVAARRIKPFLKEGDVVQRGQVIGLINLGSQTLVVTTRKNIKVSVGQKVIDGETVLA